MKKIVVLCIFIFSLLAGGIAGASFEDTPLTSVVSMYADGDGGYYCIEINDSKYFWRHVNEKSEVLAEARLTSNSSEYFYSCNGIVADKNGNVYVASYEKNSLQEIYAKYVQVFDKNGKKLRTIFETPLNTETPDETEKLKSLQYVNGKIYMFEMLATGRLLHYEYDCESGVEKRTEYIIHDGRKMLEATYAGEHGIFYTTSMGEVYHVNSSNEYVLLDINPGYETVIPMRLSYNEGGLYFTDAHNLTFVRYDMNTKAAEVLYTEDDIVGGDMRFRQLRFVRWYNGELYAHSPIFSEQGFLMRLSKTPIVISDVTRSHGAVFVFATKVFAIAFAGLSLLAAFVYAVIRLRSLLLKLLIILTILMGTPVLFISSEFADTFDKQVTNEINAQLYTLATSLSGVIDGKTLRELNFPQDIESDFIRNLFSNIDSKIDDFKYPNKDYIPKNLFYTLYTVKDNTAYYAYGYDYPSGMRDEYMQLYTNEFFRDNTEYETRMVEYRDKYGMWIVCRAFIMDDGAPVGMFETGMRRDMVDEKIKEIHLHSLIKASFIAVGGMVVLALVLRHMLKGLKVLKVGLAQMTDGNWSARAIVKSGDEIEDIANDFNKMARHIEKYVDSVTRLNTAYKKFVPNELFELLDKNSVFEIRLGDQSDKNLTIMSVSIRDFHSLSRELTADECFNMLNGVFAASARAIRKNGGFIENFGGFGLRAVFKGRTDEAVDSALRLIEKINSHNKDGGVQIRLNIIIQNGDSMIGIAGDSERMAETVISEEARNIMALERIAEKHQIGLIITESAFNRINEKEKYNYCRIGALLSDNRLIALYDFIDAYEPAKRYLKIETKSDFETGLALYGDGQLREARKKFVDVLRIDNSNEIAKLYLFRCDDQQAVGHTEKEAFAL